MPYKIKKVVGGYKVNKTGTKMMMSKKALTKSKATKQKKAIEISEAMRKRLREHAKVHQGGMSGKHMRNMVRFIKAGDNFRMAHEKAVKLDMPKKKIVIKPNRNRY